jgi:hypothetical protein
MQDLLPVLTSKLFPHLMFVPMMAYLDIKGEPFPRIKCLQVQDSTQSNKMSRQSPTSEPTITQVSPWGSLIVTELN